MATPEDRSLASRVADVFLAKSLITRRISVVPPMDRLPPLARMIARARPVAAPPRPPAAAGPAGAGAGPGAGAGLGAGAGPGEGAGAGWGTTARMWLATYAPNCRATSRFGRNTAAAAAAARLTRLSLIRVKAAEAMRIPTCWSPTSSRLPQISTAPGSPALTPGAT